MSRRPYRETGKSFGVRTVELLRALQVVNDCLQELRKGRVQHLASLSGQLRALLTEKTRKADPLLLTVAKVLGRRLAVYCMPDVNDDAMPAPLREGMLFALSGFPISAYKQFSAQTELALDDMLAHAIVNYKGTKYTVGDVINWYANWSGGAHYSRNLPSDFSDMLSLNAVGIQPLANAMVQIGEATLACGRDLLKSVVDLEVHALVAVPEQDCADVNYLFDARYEGSSMRLSIFLNKRRMPSFYASGLQGTWARVDSDRLIDWSEPRHLHASLRIDDDLSTLLELSVDGRRVGRLRIDEPLFVLSDPLDYDNFHNKSVDGDAQHFSFGIAQVGMVGSELSPLDKAKVDLHFDARRTDPNLKLVAYLPGSFAHAARGTKDLKMSGTVRRCAAKEFLPNGLNLTETPEKPAERTASESKQEQLKPPD